MVARARATRITHLFSEKTKKELPDKFTAVSQRYSKGNIAIFAQDVASLRTILPPPKQEIHEAMCTLFIGPSVAPTFFCPQPSWPTAHTTQKVPPLIPRPVRTPTHLRELFSIAVQCYLSKEFQVLRLLHYEFSELYHRGRSIHECRELCSCCTFR
ncbi:hypothetical protein C8R44DRAFT_645606 [Mycena epipterygia]|nr:hypothetical protein C8R44DRAFT_645606 [Mycena epipterygia]